MSRSGEAAVTVGRPRGGPGGDPGAPTGSRARNLIIYLGAFQFPDHNAAALRARANATLLRAAGYEVMLVGHGPAGGGGVPGGTVDGFACELISGPVGAFGWARYVLGRGDVLALLERHAARLQAVVCYNFPAIATLRIRRLGKTVGFRTVGDVTEWYDASGGSLLFRAAKAFDTALRMRVVNRMMDGLITTSPYLTGFYSRTGLPMIELPTLFDPGAFTPPAATVDGTPTFVYAGSPFAEGRVNRARTNVKDRLDLCVAAFARAAALGYRFRFELFGVTREQYVAVYPEHTSALAGARGRIRFHGQVANTEVRAAIAAASFTVFFRDPTRTVLAGFPTKLAESITAGTPVITNAHANVRLLEGTPGVWLVPMGKEDEVILRAIQCAPQEVAALKEACFASREFDPRRYDDAMRGFLRELVGEVDR